MENKKVARSTPKPFPKLFKKDRVAAVLVAARQAAREELKSQRERDKSVKSASLKK